MITTIVVSYTAGLVVGVAIAAAAGRVRVRPTLRRSAPPQLGPEWDYDPELEACRLTQEGGDRP